MLFTCIHSFLFAGNSLDSQPKTQAGDWREDSFLNSEVMFFCYSGRTQVAFASYVAPFSSMELVLFVVLAELCFWGVLSRRLVSLSVLGKCQLSSVVILYLQAAHFIKQLFTR